MRKIAAFSLGLSTSAALLCGPAHDARAQAAIEVVASKLRDGLDVSYLHGERAAIADDGAVLFAASSSTTPDQLYLASAGAVAHHLGLSDSIGMAVAISDDSIVYVSNNAVRSVARVAPTASAAQLLNCAGQCGVDRLDLTRNGWLAVSTLNGPNLYRMRVQQGAPFPNGASPDIVPKPQGVVTVLECDAGEAGEILFRASCAGSMAEYYSVVRLLQTSTGAFTPDTQLSTREPFGVEEPIAAAFGSQGQPLVLRPAQTAPLTFRIYADFLESGFVDHAFMSVVSPAGLFAGTSAPFKTRSVYGSLLLALADVSAGSMDANSAGLAAVSARLLDGFAGLFSVDTTTSAPSATKLVELGQPFGQCSDLATSIRVLGVNQQGQIVARARVQTGGGVDTQLWRVTPASALSTSWCWSQVSWEIKIPVLTKKDLPWQLPLEVVRGL